MILVIVMNIWIHLLYSICPNMQTQLLLFLILFILIFFFYHQFRFVFTQFLVIILFQSIIYFTSLRTLIKFLTYQTLLFTISFLNPNAFILIHIYIFIILISIQLIRHFSMSVHFLNYLFNLLKLVLYSQFAVPKYFHKSLDNLVAVWSDLKAQNPIIFKNQAWIYKDFKACLMVENN